jgi:AraC-like DNA-binding protein
MEHTFLQYLRLRKAIDTTHDYSYELTADRVEYISNQLERFVHNEKPFLQYRYSIRDLANDIHAPGYQLSAYLNQILGVNFNDYLNKYRVKYCEELIHDGLVAQFNLKGLAQSCGFNNRNTFSSAFKKFTGYTPSFYMKANHSKNAVA